MARQLRLWIGIGVLGLALLSAGCVTDGMGNKQAGGTAIGALAGGLAGSLFGSGQGKTVAIVAGALAGAALGNYIGSILDERDQQAVAAESARTLSTARDGQTNTWSNPDSGASAAITVEKTERVTRKVPIVREKYVASPGELVLINTAHEALKTSNVRSGPGTNYKAVNLLQQGDVVTVVGQVKDRNWYMVGRDGRSIGYVYASLLREMPESTGAPEVVPVQTAKASAEQGQQQASQETADPSLASARQGVLRTEALDLKDIESSMDLEGQGLVAEEVEAETEVRTVTVAVENDKGQQETNTFRASRAGDGAWEVI